MYEIWLAANILWELALFRLPLVLSYLLTLGIVLILALRLKPPGWRAALIPALLLGAAVTLASMLLVPWLSGARLSDLAYWVDWANLFAIAAGFGAAAAALGWPLACLLKKRPG